MRGGCFFTGGGQEKERAYSGLASGNIVKTRVFWLFFEAIPKGNNFIYRILRLFCGGCHKILAEVLGLRKAELSLFQQALFSGKKPEF